MKRNPFVLPLCKQARGVPAKSVRIWENAFVQIFNLIVYEYQSTNDMWFKKVVAGFVRFLHLANARYILGRFDKLQRAAARGGTIRSTVPHTRMSLPNFMHKLQRAAARGDTIRSRVPHTRMSEPNLTHMVIFLQQELSPWDSAVLQLRYLPP